MKQIIRIAVNNVLNTGIKGIVIVVLMALSMFIATISISFSNSSKELIGIKTEALESKFKVTVMPKESSKTISITTLDYLETLDGISYVLPQYNISGLMEEIPGTPIYPVTFNGYDFQNNVFMGELDFCGEDVSGIVLPDISVEHTKKLKLKEYVGNNVYITYDYIKGNEVVSKTIECKVLGVYSAKGPFEANPAYMTMDLFEEVLKNCSSQLNGVGSAEVYVESSEMIKNVGEKISDMGYEVFFESTIEDYISSLEGFISLAAAVSVIIMIMAMIIIAQAIAINIKKRSTIIGVLKAYGYSNFSICFMVCIEVFTYSILAVMISVSTCIVTQGMINEILGEFLYDVKFVVKTEAVALQIAIAGAMAVFASIIPIRKLRKINVIDVLKAS